MKLRFPTRILFSGSLIKCGLRIGRKYSDQVPDLPQEAVDALCRQIRNIKKKHGTWELVDVESAEGDRVKIIL